MGLARGRWGPVLVRPCRSGGLSWKGRTRTGIAGAIIRGLTRDKGVVFRVGARGAYVSGSKVFAFRLYIFSLIISFFNSSKLRISIL